MHNKRGEIDSKDISVVVQGAIDKENTPKCLASIRKHLPDAEIILSTWKDSEVEGLDFDVLIENNDPGADNYTRSDGAITPCNINRQLLSTLNGLKNATRKYSLKFRSDLVLESNKILQYYHKFPKRNKLYIFFKEKVLISSVYTKTNSHINGMPVPYHPTDWWFFGLTEDLLKYFDVPLADKSNFYSWQYKNPLNNPYPKCKERYFIEQYYFIAAFSKKFDLKYEDITCWSAYTINLWKRLLVSNFIVIDVQESKVYSAKHHFLRERNNGKDKTFKGLVWSNDYRKLYKELLNKEDIPFKDLNAYTKLTPKDFGYEGKILLDWEKSPRKISVRLFGLKFSMRRK